MATILKSILLHLALLPACLAYTQNAQTDSPNKVPEATNPSPVDNAALPQVHLLRLKHSDAKELADSLEKIFEENINAGQLAIVGDARANRLVIRASDRVFVDVRNLVEELDMAEPAKTSTAQSQPGTSTPAPIVNEELESLRRIVQAIKDSGNDPNMPFRNQLVDAVQRDFDKQQQQLRTELAELRTKLSSLQMMLEKRDSERNSICLKRIQTLLSGQATEQKPTTNPLFRDPSITEPLSPPSPMAKQERSARSTPFHTNISLDASTIADEITTILQADLLGEEGMQIFLDGKPTSLATTVPFQLSNTANRVEFEVASSRDKRAFVAVKLECEQASEDFWKRIVLEKIRLTVKRDELDRVSTNQMITKCVYLPKQPGKGLTWLVSDQVEPGVDLREKSRELGQPVVTMTITQSSAGQ